MQVERVIETCLYADNLAEAAAFYRDVLGLESFAQTAGRHIFFRCGEGIFLLFNPAQTEQPSGAIPTHGARGPGHVAFAMRQADIPAWRERLRRRAVAIEAEVAWPSDGYSLYFRDPAGNSVELTTPQTWGLAELAGSSSVEQKD